MCISKLLPSATSDLFARTTAKPPVAQKERLIATEHKTRLKRNEKCGDSAMAFYFDKPPGFEFEAGQYIDLTLSTIGIDES